MTILALLQTFSLPVEWVAAHSPETVAIQSGEADIFLSMDVAQSKVVAALAFVYFTVFLLSILTVRTSVAQVLVWSGVLQATA